MTTQRSEVLIRAPLDRVREILLRPLELPEWNAAFTALAGPATPSVGDHDLTIRNGLKGSLQYEHIDARRVVVRWSTLGFRESATWSLEPNGEMTRVVHEFDHEGGLALLLRHAFRTVAQQRNERLARRAEAGLREIPATPRANHVPVCRKVAWIQPTAPSGIPPGTGTPECEPAILCVSSARYV